jgi:hypothetical protein
MRFLPKALHQIFETLMVEFIYMPWKVDEGRGHIGQYAICYCRRVGHLNRQAAGESELPA